MPLSRKQYILDLVTNIVGDKITAELVVERLSEEGLLTLGYGNEAVDKVVDKFKGTFGTTKTSRQDRFAAHRLTQKYSDQAVCGVIDLLAQHSTEKYAPVVGSISQLETKWVSVLNFLRNLKSDETIDA